MLAHVSPVPRGSRCGISWKLQPPVQGLCTEPSHTLLQEHPARPGTACARSAQGQSRLRGLGASARPPAAAERCAWPPPLTRIYQSYVYSPGIQSCISVALPRLRNQLSHTYNASKNHSRGKTSIRQSLWCAPLNLLPATCHAVASIARRRCTSAQL